MKAIYLGLLSGGNYLGLIISIQLFCRQMVGAPIVQGLIIWGATTREAFFFGAGALSGGKLIREGSINLGYNFTEGNYPRGQLSRGQLPVELFSCFQKYVSVSSANK